MAQYGPSVDSGSAEATAALWTEDGLFDAVAAIEMHGHDQIAGMVRSDGHQNLIHNGCGHVLTVPHVVVNGDAAEGRSYALNIRWDRRGRPFLGCPGVGKHLAMDTHRRRLADCRAGQCQFGWHRCPPRDARAEEERNDG